MIVTDDFGENAHVVPFLLHLAATDQVRDLFVALIGPHRLVNPAAQPWLELICKQPVDYIQERLAARGDVASFALQNFRVKAALLSALQACKYYGVKEIFYLVTHKRSCAYVVAQNREFVERSGPKVSVLDAAAVRERVKAFSLTRLVYRTNLEQQSPLCEAVFRISGMPNVSCRVQAFLGTLESAELLEKCLEVVAQRLHGLFDVPPVDLPDALGLVRSVRARNRPSARCARCAATAAALLAQPEEAARATAAARAPTVEVVATQPADSEGKFALGGATLFLASAEPEQSSSVAYQRKFAEILRARRLSAIARVDIPAYPAPQLMLLVPLQGGLLLATPILNKFHCTEHFFRLSGSRYLANAQCAPPPAPPASTAELRPQALTAVAADSKRVAAFALILVKNCIKSTCTLIDYRFEEIYKQLLAKFSTPVCD